MNEDQMVTEVLHGEAAADNSRYALYENGTYMVISKFAYLIGVPTRIFENEYEPPRMEWYEKLQQDKNARIIRNLCMLRTAFERNYQSIYQAMRYDMKGIISMPEYVPKESIDQLAADGISIYHANAQPIQYIIDINGHISNRINNCKNLFPIWLNWDYIRQLFIMPGGTTEKGAKAAAADYYAHKEIYPYQVYMNWSAPASVGNILFNDKKFVRLLYEHHEDYFTDMSKVTDAGLIAKNGIYDFLERSNRTAIVVDCENADPYSILERRTGVMLTATKLGSKAGVSNREINRRLVDAGLCTRLPCGDYVLTEEGKQLGSIDLVVRSWGKTVPLVQWDKVVLDIR